MSNSKKSVTRVMIKGSIQQVWDALAKQGEPLPPKASLLVIKKGKAVSLSLSLSSVTK